LPGPPNLIPFTHPPCSLLSFTGGIINRYLILSAVQMYERMGMGKLDVYRADLEPDLLEDTRLDPISLPWILKFLLGLNK
jgi:hypothetical protein